eukprot:425287-Amphidinium_carterae.1
MAAVRAAAVPTWLHSSDVEGDKLETRTMSCAAAFALTICRLRIYCVFVVSWSNAFSIMLYCFKNGYPPICVHGLRTCFVAWITIISGKHTKDCDAPVAMLSMCIKHGMPGHVLLCHGSKTFSCYLLHCLNRRSGLGELVHSRTGGLSSSISILTSDMLSTASGHIHQPARHPVGSLGAVRLRT